MELLLSTRVGSACIKLVDINLQTKPTENNRKGKIRVEMHIEIKYNYH